MRTMKGIPASPGIQQAPAWKYESDDIEVSRAPVGDPSSEWQRLTHALERARSQVAEIHIRALSEVGSSEAAIFEAHRMFLEDPALLARARQGIFQSEISAEAAWAEGFEYYAAKLEGLGDELLRARAADVRDVGALVLRILLGRERSSKPSPSAPSIVIARDLTPSDTIGLDRAFVRGFATMEGGPTSHTAILAKALQLPAVVGLGQRLFEVDDGALVLIDGERGEIVVEPDVAAAEAFARRSKEVQRIEQEASEHAEEPAQTTDGHRVEVVANIGRVEEARAAIGLGAEGVGLLRTEFLYLERSYAPSEEEQLHAYGEILDAFESRPVVVRTLDAGGDKELRYLDPTPEANPFLGWRAIRLCLDRPDLFKTQLRALLRASVGHDLRIMFPMVAILDEVRRAKNLLYEARKEVEAAGHRTASAIQVGIMVEVPAVAVMADQFAREVDFLSIGTNDLTQYTMAAERTNQRVAYLGDACHPAVLRQIRGVIKAGHQAGIWVGLCGELAGDPQGIPILLGLGLDEFSMAPGFIPHAKALIRKWSFAGARELAALALDLDSAPAVRAAVATSSPA